MIETNSGLMVNKEEPLKSAVRCSVILSAGEKYSRLSEYLWTLSKAGLVGDYELIVINDRSLEINERQLGASLPKLKVMNPAGPLTQKQWFDMGAMAAKGEYLLFVRRFVDFEKLLLEESIEDLETSKEKVSISANNNFVLTKRLHYAISGGFTGLFPSLDLGVGETRLVKNYSVKDKKGTVLIVVCLFENNFGDILIYETINKKLRDAGFKTEIVEVSQPLCQSKLIERANNCDFLYFAGGGIIERWAPEIITHFDSLHKDIRVPYGVMGLGTGVFDYGKFSNSLKLFSENASFFYTRDKESIETFREAGAHKLPVAGVDVVFANDNLTKLKRTGNGITASFRNVPYTDVTGDLNWSMWTDALRKIGVQSLIRDCHDAQKKLRIPINNGDILEQISASDIIVAMRFHMIVAASMIGVLTIPINYCPKIKRLARQLGIENYCLELNDHDKLKPTLRHLKSNEKTVRKDIETKVIELKSRTNEIINNSIRTIEKNINEKRARQHEKEKQLHLV